MDTSYAEVGRSEVGDLEVQAPTRTARWSVEAGTHRLVRISPSTTRGVARLPSRPSRSSPSLETTDHIEIPESELKIDVFAPRDPAAVNTTDRPCV